MNQRSPNKLGQPAEDFVAQLFRSDGWKVQRDVAVGPYRADLVNQRQG